MMIMGMILEIGGGIMNGTISNITTMIFGTPNLTNTDVTKGLGTATAAAECYANERKDTETDTIGGKDESIETTIGTWTTMESGRGLGETETEEAVVEIGV